MTRLFLSLLLTLSYVAGSLWGGEANVVDFAEDVRPILARHCVACHGAEEVNGGIRLDDPKMARAEADSGSFAIVPGRPDESELIVRITSDYDGDRMPPEGPSLSAEDVRRLKTWIEQGAPWPESESSTDERSGGELSDGGADHWSFRPLARSGPPRTDQASTTLDQFVAAKRQEIGVTAAPPAGPAALIRRASFGLTGLPPTPEEVARFASAEATLGRPLAMEQLVDELLSRPTYGQRWGRHWMDWVRYADTAGDNSDFPIPQAYLYRNYIIDSINDDVPYDRFLTEQLAGDLLPADSQAERNRLVIATGYLAMARRFGSLVERYPWHLTIEDTIDNVGRTMLGMTIACARCHDHKFDPISTRDYYGLYGIFASTRYPFPGIELFQTQHDLVPLIESDRAAATMEPFAEKTRELESRLTKLLDQCERQSLENAERAKTSTIDEQRKMQDELDRMLLKARRAGQELADHLKSLPEMPMAYAVQDAEPIDASIQIKGEPDRPGAVVPRKFPDVLGGQQLPDDLSSETSGRLQLARWITAEDNPLTARVIVNRVWQRHFGTGLVASTSDFGLRGETPSHPELLDRLAADFIRHGWSLKHLHRTIMTSQTYQLSSRDLPENLAIDPVNRWLWKFNRRRLDAESIRDALLMIGGNLDVTPLTDPHPFPPKKEWKYTQHHPFKDSYENSHRSVYQMTKRLTAQRYMQTFDGPDPNVCTSTRDQSVTALQALYFMNDDFLHAQADRIARRIADQADDEDQRIALTVSTILCRLPSSDETDQMKRHIESVRERLSDSPDAENVAWSSLTLSLLRLNEFLYLD